MFVCLFKLLHPGRSYFDIWKCNSSLYTQSAINFCWWAECLVSWCNAREVFSSFEGKFLCCSHPEGGFWCFWSECLFWNYHISIFIIRYVHYWSNVLNYFKKILKCKFQCKIQMNKSIKLHIVLFFFRTCSLSDKIPSYIAGIFFAWFFFIDFLFLLHFLFKFLQSY